MAVKRSPVSRAPDAVAGAGPRARRRHWLLAPAVALFLVLASLYVLTSGGHTYSFDEETMFALTESLATRGSVEIRSCDNCAVLRSKPAPGGHNYSRYGPLLSVVAVPFYLVGRAVAGSDDAARWFATRFFAVLLNPLATATTAVFLYGIVRALGYRVRIALATALVYGLGTQAWPYAKTFFAEPLTTCLLSGAVYSWLRFDLLPSDRARQAARWAGGIGLGCGLAIATKWAATIAAPVLGLAVAATLLRRWRTGAWSFRQVLGAGLAAAGALALPVGAVMLYNYARFGSPFETGYGAAEVDAIQSGQFWGPLAAMLVSPGKSVFIYSPAALLALPAWPRFARRHRRLALVAGGLTLIHLGFYSRVPHWHGDVAWGPRHLVYAAPLLTLPLASGLAWLGAQPALRRRAIATLGTLVAVVALVGVQLPGILVNFDTAYQRVTVGNRFWDWANFPPYVATQLLRERVDEWREARFPTRDGVTPGKGFDVLNEDDPLWPRFLPAVAELHVHAGGNGAIEGALLYQDARARRDPPQRIAVLVNGRLVTTARETPAPESGYPAAYRLTFPIRSAGQRATDFTVTVRNDNFALLGRLRLLDFSATRAGVALPAYRRPLLLPFPQDQTARWSWFMAGRNQHLVDVWLWYLAVLQLPAAVTRQLLLGVGGGALFALGVGLLGLVAAWRGDRLPAMEASAGAWMRAPSYSRTRQAPYRAP